MQPLDEAFDQCKHSDLDDQCRLSTTSYTFVKEEHLPVFRISGSGHVKNERRSRSVGVVETAVSTGRRILLRPLSIALSPLRQIPTKFFIASLDHNYIQRHSFPLAVPAATQSFVGWNCATAGTAVIPPPPSCASCSPFDV